MNSVKTVSFLLVALVAPIAMASSGGGGHEDLHHIPGVIVYQAINVALTALLLTYLAKQKLKDHLTNKKITYQQTIQKVESARDEAEKKNFELKTRVTRLEETAQEAIERAQKEAEELHKRIVSDAHSLAENIREEARRTAKAETLRAIQHLREDVIALAIAGARDSLGGEIRDTDQQRLQRESLEKIEVVQ